MLASRTCGEVGRTRSSAAPAHPASSPHASLSGQGSCHRLHRSADTARTAARFAEVRRRMDQRLRPADRASLGPLRGADGRAIAVEGLWDLEPGTAANGGTDAV